MMPVLVGRAHKLDCTKEVKLLSAGHYAARGWVWLKQRVFVEQIWVIDFVD